MSNYLTALTALSLLTACNMNTGIAPKQYRFAEERCAGNDGLRIVEARPETLIIYCNNGMSAVLKKP